MISYLQRLVGHVTVEEIGSEIHVSGVPANDIVRDIVSMWSTSRIAVHMFTKLNASSFVFNRFFAIEVVYMLEKLISAKGYRHHTRHMKRIVELLKENTWLSETEIEHPNILDFGMLKRMSRRPLPHQNDFFNSFNQNVKRLGLRGYLLSSPPGTGKTYMDLALALMLKADMVFIIAPNNSIYDVWLGGIRKEVDLSANVWVSQDKKPLLKNNKWNVFHYEAMDKAIELAKMSSSKRPFIVLDESHNFNEMDSARTEKFISLCNEHLPHAMIVWASGTALKAMGKETVPLFSTIDPLFDKDAQNRFLKIFGKNTQRAMDIIAHRIGLVTFKVDKRAVVDIDPKVIPVKIKLKNGSDYTLESVKTKMNEYIKDRVEYYKRTGDKYLADYEKCLREFESTLRTPAQKSEFARYRQNADLIRKKYDPVLHKEIVVSCNKYEKQVIIPNLSPKNKHLFRDAKSVYKYVNLKIQGECLGRVLGNLRVRCNKDMVDAVDFASIIEDAEKKTLVYSSYVDVVLSSRDRLVGMGYKPEVVYADTNKNLTSIIGRFDKDPDVNPLVATFDSLSTAVPLVMANTIIMMNSPFRDYEYNQTVSRCARLDQDAEVNVYMVTLDTGDEPNLSTRAKDIMEWSRLQVALLMGEKDPITLDEGYFSIAAECFEEQVVSTEDLPSVYW